MTAQVYVATSGRGTKVGYSNNPRSRLKQVAAEIGQPVTLAYASGSTDNAEVVEMLAHWLLRDSHAGSEWFTVSALDAIAAVKDAALRVAAGEVAPRRINNATPFALLKEVRTQLVMSQGELDALDEWRAQHKIWSRGEAIRRLIAVGIKEKAQKAEKP